MTTSQPWNAAASVSACSVIAWSGSVYRGHMPKYPATSSTGSLMGSGRFNCGEADPDNTQTITATCGRRWPVLYTSLGRDTAMGEIMRHITADRLPRMKAYRYTCLDVSLQRVLDCRDEATLGISHKLLWQDFDFRYSQELALAALAHVDALLIPSATLLGDNLIIFDQNLMPGSYIYDTGDFIEPPLYVRR